MKTHKFKKNLENDNATKFFDPQCDLLQKSGIKDLPNHNISELLVNLQIVNKSFLLAHTSTAFYIFDLEHSKIISWNNSFGSIHTIKVVLDAIILFTEDQKAYSFQIFKLDDFFAKLVASELYLDGAKIIKEHLTYFLNKTNSTSFCQNYEKLRKHLISCTFLEKFNEFLTNFDTHFLKICNENIKRDNQLQNEDLQLDAEILTLNSGTECQNYDQRLGMIPIYQKHSVGNMRGKVEFEETQILNDLFIIYRSLKISNFNMRERYEMLFDGYDLPGIKSLLKTLEQMITDNDSKASLSEAKEMCAYIYLNYKSANSSKEFSKEYENFAIDCFLLINSSIKSSNVQRCEFCKFPLSGMITHFKYEEMGQTLVKRLFKLEESERLFDLIFHIPTLLNVLLIVMADERAEKVLYQKLDHNGFEIDIFVDLFFACSHQKFLENERICTPLLTSDFWFDFFSRLQKLHNDNCVRCVRCSKISKINTKTLIEFDNQYSYNSAFNNCASILNGNTALELCKLLNNIPANAISKFFYLKCMLNGNTF